jgi:hypothetical protein
MKKSKKVSKVMKKIKAQEGVMIEEAAAPSMMGAQAAPEALDRISEIDIVMAEEAARRRPLQALEEEKEKPMTPKERREKNIAERNLKKFNTKKKMGGGMMSDGVSRKGMGIEKRMGGGMMSDGIANRGSGIEMKSKGGMVRGQGIEIRGTKFKGIF